MRKTYTGNEGLRDVNSELIYRASVRSTLKNQLVAIGTSATKIPTTQLSERMFLLITNDGTVPVYIGSATVTTSGATKGFPLYPRATLRIDIEDDVDVYGIATATNNVVILEGS